MKSGIFMTKFEGTVSASVSFRVSGDALDPEDVSRFLQTKPQHTHRKGERYGTERSVILGKTGVWLFSTDEISLSSDIDEHFVMLMTILGLIQCVSSGLNRRSYALTDRFKMLQSFLSSRHLRATLTYFWHGTAHAVPPVIPDSIPKIFALVPIEVELDFDHDEDVTRRSRVA
jgi:hypothetical protein